MPQEKPKKKGSPRAQLSALLGIPQAGAVPWDQPWRIHNPENIRPGPGTAQDERVFARWGPGYEPRSDMYPGHMGLEFALLNGFRADTLSGLFGEPEGGVQIYEDDLGLIGLDEVIRKKDKKTGEKKEAVPFVYKGGRGQEGQPGYIPDRIVIQQGTTAGDKFAESLTHEYVHRAHSRGFPGADAGDEDALDLTRRLRNMSEMFGEEPMANAIARALGAIRGQHTLQSNLPRSVRGSDRDFYSDAARVEHTSDPTEYRVTPEAADSAVALLYTLLGRE
jgi:hypothetical protein